MSKEIVIILATFFFFTFKVFIQFNEIKELKVTVKELQEEVSWSASELDNCLGQVIAYDKAFDYHIVLSELGLYPQIKESLYLNKEGD